MTYFIGGVIAGLLLAIFSAIIRNTEIARFATRAVNKLIVEKGQIIERKSVLEETMEQEV